MTKRRLQTGTERLQCCTEGVLLYIRAGVIHTSRRGEVAMKELKERAGVEMCEGIGTHGDTTFGKPFPQRVIFNGTKSIFKTIY